MSFFFFISFSSKQKDLVKKKEHPSRSYQKQQKRIQEERVERNTLKKKK